MTYYDDDVIEQAGKGPMLCECTDVVLTRASFTVMLAIRMTLVQ